MEPTQYTINRCFKPLLKPREVIDYGRGLAQRRIVPPTLGGKVYPRPLAVPSSRGAQRRGNLDQTGVRPGPNVELVRPRRLPVIRDQGSLFHVKPFGVRDSRQLFRFEGRDEQLAPDGTQNLHQASAPLMV